MKKNVSTGRDVMRLLALTLKKSRKFFVESYCPLYHLPFGTTHKCGKEQEEIALFQARKKLKLFYLLLYPTYKCEFYFTVSKRAVTAVTAATAVITTTALLILLPSI
uniref:Uncharacterized protein n=1 Tax=Vespula pensylvanica TaxID=30213 RepID=A0A834UDS4_VESPE|nr:hypothetical protein H0235_002435 [Vespula pensylvanica]